jgi:hypothetical protein
MSQYDLRIEVADEAGAIGTYGPVILNVAARPLPIDRIRESSRLTKKLEQNRGKIGSYTVIEAAAVSPQPENERDETNKMMLASPLTAAALIIEGTGFRAAAARTVIAGYFILKRPYAVKVMSEANAGASWLVGELGAKGVRDLDPIELYAALGKLRAAVPRS